MIQIFLKTTTISEKDWKYVFDRIVKIVNHFPLKLERIESYNRFDKNINKIHDDLIVNSGSEDEHISFWGDKVSYSAAFTVRFYKNWEVQQKKGLVGKEIDSTKPIVWYPPQIFDFTGYPPEANAAKLNENYLDTGALYRYAVLAIGIMLENTMPGRALLITLDTHLDEINSIKLWLEYLFNEKFDTPIYFDKIRMLDNLVEHYNNKTDLVGRMDILYHKLFKNNMDFAIEHIGYKPALEYYSQVLTHVNFGTFGFSDILNSWIAATQNIEKTLELVSRSKHILLSDKENERNLKQAEKYDYSYILKDLLNQYILWTPEQREFLNKFYTNKQALETGSEDLFGALMRIGGYRIDICPIYTNAEQLFEVFMFHDPKNGNVYKRIIDDWLEKNKNKYNEAVEQFSEIEQKVQKDVEDEKVNEKNNEVEIIKLNTRIEKYAERYEEPERFFIIEALKNNPYYMDKDIVVEELQNEMFELCQKNLDNINFRHQLSKNEKIDKIRYWLKEKSQAVHPKFFDWLNEETDENVVVI